MDDARALTEGHDDAESVAFAVLVAEKDGRAVTDVRALIVCVVELLATAEIAADADADENDVVLREVSAERDSRGEVDAVDGCVTSALAVAHSLAVAVCRCDAAAEPLAEDEGLAPADADATPVAVTARLGSAVALAVPLVVEHALAAADHDAAPLTLVDPLALPDDDASELRVGVVLPRELALADIDPAPVALPVGLVARLTVRPTVMVPEELAQGVALLGADAVVSALAVRVSEAAAELVTHKVALGDAVTSTEFVPHDVAVGDADACEEPLLQALVLAEDDDAAVALLHALTLDVRDALALAVSDAARDKVAAAEKLATPLLQADALESALTVRVSDIVAVPLEHELALGEAVSLATTDAVTSAELVGGRDAEALLVADGDAVGDRETVAVPLAETVTEDDAERRGDVELHADADSEGVAVDDALCDANALSVEKDGVACAVVESEPEGLPDTVALPLLLRVAISVEEPELVILGDADALNIAVAEYDEDAHDVEVAVAQWLGLAVVDRDALPQPELLTLALPDADAELSGESLRAEDADATTDAEEVGDERELRDALFETV